MRIAGWQVPPGYLRWAAVGLGLLAVGIVAAVVASALGLFGFTTAAEDAGTRVSASVAAGAPCSASGATETVTFEVDGTDRQARFDGCGHAKGEPVEILVPPGPAGDDLVVHSAGAAVGDRAPGQGLGFVLFVVSGLAGAGYAFLIRRGPRGTALPPALRLAS
ncbi:MAG: hypothetical protein GEV28_40355 [Actinophytocola sp.]|uniref:hypothetical protein n=1 Tax=Actinophytocola sp. TaxID=1872138 RepID=UPI001324ABEF|nr:hypothetical protein [Actinophytocola sp.]MPZ86293.1 hypothetical protein [Actinophytocola sp.]